VEARTLPIAVFGILGFFFGLVAGLAAFLISYREYSARRLGSKAMRLSLMAAAEAFLFFFLAALGLGWFMKGF
jgi:hypothetical protein